MQIGWDKHLIGPTYSLSYMLSLLDLFQMLLVDICLVAKQKSILAFEMNFIKENHVSTAIVFYMVMRLVYV